MQGPNYLDLAKNLAESHFEGADNVPYSPTAKKKSNHIAAREWLGHKLINTGERLVPHPGDLRLEVSTGPPRL
jgi:hypothetical protein